MNKTTKNIILVILFFLLTITLGIVAKGSVANETLNYQSLDDRGKAVGSPFESSGSTSRFALTESIVEDGTLSLNTERARFASPDVTEYQGEYFSLFTPGVSFVGVPFYFLGKYFGIQQFATYMSTVFFAVFNTLLVALVARKIGGSFLTSIMAGLLFLFGTNALTYATTFTQHHASTFVILLGLLSALDKRTFANNVLFGALFGVGVLIDAPNAIMMLPLVIYILIKQFEVKNLKNKFKFNLRLSFMGLLIGLIPFLGVFGWYNYQTTGSYATLTQFIGRTSDFRGQQLTEEDGEEDVEISLPFNTRNQLNGFYTFLISTERSIPVYSPIVLLGFLGLYIAYKNKQKREVTIVVITVFLGNLLTYMLFSDPTGSWAFGPRYLIPGMAILSAGLGVALTKYKKRPLFAFAFSVLAAYSIGVNVLGAMTTTQVPPKVEAVNLADPIPYTYEYNWQLITEQGLNSSLFYDLYLSDTLTPKSFALIYSLTIFGVISALYYLSTLDKKFFN